MEPETSRQKIMLLRMRSFVGGAGLRGPASRQIAIAISAATPTNAIPAHNHVRLPDRADFEFTVPSIALLLAECCFR